jgi:hypothetical protein
MKYKAWFAKRMTEVWYVYNVCPLALNVQVTGPAGTAKGVSAWPKERVADRE